MKTRRFMRIVRITRHLARYFIHQDYSDLLEVEHYTWCDGIQ